MSDIVIMFKEPAIVVQDGCTMMYYSQVNGKELGSRRGTYKNGNLTPYTERDAEIEEAHEQKEAAEAEHKAEALNLDQLLTGRESGLYYDIRQHMSLEEIKAAVKKLTR